MAKLVRDLMRPGVLTCKPNSTLGQVARFLTQHHVHALFVAGDEARSSGLSPTSICWQGSGYRETRTAWKRCAR